MKGANNPQGTQESKQASNAGASTSVSFPGNYRDTKNNDSDDKSDEDSSTTDVSDEEVAVVSNPPASKGYRTLRPSLNGESEGDSESEDPNVVWRGLKDYDLASIQAGRGIGAKKTISDGGSDDVTTHVKDGPNDSCLISASRSKKVAARYSTSVGVKLNGNNPARHIAKIQLDEHDQRSDLTNNTVLLATNLEAFEKRWAENSQEVILYHHVPQDKIVGLYHAQHFHNRNIHQYVQTKEATDVTGDFVKFRPVEKPYYHGFHITPVPMPSTLSAITSVTTGLTNTELGSSSASEEEDKVHPISPKKKSK